MTKRFANVMKSLGVEKGDVVGIYMPMIPETPAAMLACARIGATHNVVFGGFSVEAVKERMEVSDAKLLVTANANAAPRQADPDEGAGRRRARRPAEDGARRRRQARRHRHADEGRPRRLVARGVREGGRRLPGRAARRRAPALHPLHVGLDREAEGHPAHDRRLPDRRRRHPQRGLRPEAATPTSTGARPTSAGSPATPTSSTARSATARRR